MRYPDPRAMHKNHRPQQLTVSKQMASHPIRSASCQQPHSSQPDAPRTAHHRQQSQQQIKLTQVHTGIQLLCHRSLITANTKMLSLQPRTLGSAHTARSQQVLLRSSHICRAGVRRAMPGSSSVQQRREQHQEQLLGAGAAGSAFATSFSLYLLSAAPAVADVADAAGGSTPFQGVTANSLYVTLALFLMTAPGKAAAGGFCHSPCAAVVRNTAAATQPESGVVRMPAVRATCKG